MKKQLRANNALDFDDLLVKTVQLFQTQPEILDYYQERFRYIMVDEYQDTNKAQFKLVSFWLPSTGTCAWWEMMTSPSIGSEGRILKIS